MTVELLLMAQQAVPRMDSMYWIMLASRILHILGAIILLGGLFYLRTVVTSGPLPLREGQGEGSSSADLQFGGRRPVWAMWVGIASLLLFVTGLWNYVQMIKMHERLSPSYHMIAGLKMLDGLTLFVLAAILAGRSAVAEMLRQNMRAWLNVCLILGIITVAFGSVLRTFPRTLKVDAPNGPQLVAPADTPSN